MAYLKLCFVAFCCTLLSGLTTADDDNQLNNMIDEVIYENVEPLIKKGLDKVSIPDLIQQYHLPIFNGVRAELNLTEISFWNTTSIQRVGDANEVDGPDGAMTFSVAMGLKIAKAQFNLSYRLGFIHAKKNINFSCGKNSIYLQVTIKYDDQHNCSVSLDNAEIRDLSDFEITFMPSTMMDSLESHLLSFVTNELAERIKTTVNKRVEPILKKYMDKVNICGALPF